MGVWAAPGQTRVTMFFVILVTHLKSYIETTDRRDFGGRPSKWRLGRVLSWKIPEFCSVSGARSKNSILRVFRVPFDYLCTAYRKQFYPKSMAPMESRASEGVPYASLWPGIWQIHVSEGCRKVVTWTSRKLKICIKTHVKKIHWFQKCYSFRSMMTNNEVNMEKPFQNSGVTRRLWRCQHATVL